MIPAKYDYARPWEQADGFTPAARSRKQAKKVNPIGKILRRLFFKVGLVFFAYGIVLVYLTFQSASLGYQIVALEKDIERLQISSARLDYEIAQLSSLDSIETRAQQELGMKKPDMKMAMTIPASTLQAVKAEETQPADVKEEGPGKPLEKVYTALLFLADKAQ